MIPSIRHGTAAVSAGKHCQIIGLFSKSTGHLLPVTWRSASCLSPAWLARGWLGGAGHRRPGGHRALCVPSNVGAPTVRVKTSLLAWKAWASPNPDSPCPSPPPGQSPCVPPGPWLSSPPRPTLQPPCPGALRPLCALGHSRQELAGQHRLCHVVFLEARITSACLLVASSCLSWAAPTLPWGNAVLVEKVPHAWALCTMLGAPTGQQQPTPMLAAHSSIIAWKSPRSEEAAGLQSTELQRAGRN